jgi:large subunit ribosomal protein L18
MSKTIRQRRLKGKTDYKARLALLKSEKPRLVVRKTNRYIIAQLVVTEIAQDKVMIGLSSKSLLTKGWPKEKSGSLKSLAACYLTGLLIGKLAKEKYKEAILDMGMYRNIQKSRLYSFLKGAIDAGLKVPHGKEALPNDEQIKQNANVKEFFEKEKIKLKKKCLKKKGHWLLGILKQN